MDIGISIIQWFLIIWLLTIFLKSIYEIIDKEPPSGLFIGLFFILLGLYWFFSLRNSINLKPWIGSFYVGGLVGVILISGGIRILLKPPFRSWVSASIILVLVISLFLYGPSKNGSNNFFDFIGSNVHWDSGKWLPDSSLAPKKSTEFQYFGTREYNNVSLNFTNNKFAKSNIHFSSKETNNIFGIKGATNVKLNRFSDYDIESIADSEVILNQNLRDIQVETNIGNFSGEIKNNLEIFEAHTDTGFLAFTFFGEAKEIRMETNIGNQVVNLYKPVNRLILKSNVGNIEIHIAKGIRVDMNDCKTNIGKISVSENGDGSNGIIDLELKTDIGNITVIADL